ncbi:outer membrane beta-barrel protein [Plebeiibacterium sediminum]|uniref:PorT family protein n=1 Tax=Plebeiibacterium sediminum TaxID=2992112 RepID=A0AAE3M370_9BACT|nr:outer membrane beta-barrel protein [Plebeiobacterium sediminum]MCW3786284.1 PorT family protein [Plebeiobacterium sediminum]
MRQKILLVIALISMSLHSYSQTKHEVNFNLGAASSSMKFDMDDHAQTASKIAPVFGIGYTYKINTQWGFVTGLELATYKSEIKIKELKDHYLTQDNYSNDFVWNLKLNNYQENQDAFYLNIPLQIQFSPEKLKNLYTNIGLKIGIPLSGKFESNNNSLVTSGYYPETNAEYTDLNFRGFGEFDGSTSKGDIDFGVAIMLSVECGKKWKLSNSTKLYAGGYLDYGLNNILKTQGAGKIIEYDRDNPTNLRNNSISGSEHTKAETTAPMVNNVVPQSIGIKIKLGFAL